MTSQLLPMQEAEVGRQEAVQQLQQAIATTAGVQAELQQTVQALQDTQAELAVRTKRLDWTTNQLHDAEDAARSAAAIAQRTALVVSPSKCCC